MSIRGATREALLALAATAGAACLVWMLAATTLGWTMVVFRTGSMAPTMPVGTAAIAVPTAATDLTIGDVVMVQREGQLPVTHRVVSVTPRSGGTAELQLRGDANAANDPQPYLIERAHKVVLPVPGLGYAIETMRTPIVLGTTTLIVSATVLWALWPPRRRAHRAEAAS